MNDGRIPHVLALPNGGVREKNTWHLMTAALKLNIDICGVWASQNVTDKNNTNRQLRFG